MENIGSITYRPDLNQMSIPRSCSRKALRFFERFDPEKVKTFVGLVLLGIEPIRKPEDVHLEAFLAESWRVETFREYSPRGLGLVVYPRQGEIKTFYLNPETKFFSDNHTNPDPLTITTLEYGLHIHRTRTEDYLWVGHTDKSVPNRITGGLLFKTNPFEHPRRYPGFDKFTKLKLIRY